MTKCKTSTPHPVPKISLEKDKVIDAVYLNKTEEDKWSFMYPLEKFSIGESSKVIKGIIYLCEKEYQQAMRLLAAVSITRSNLI